MRLNAATSLKAARVQHKKMTLKKAYQSIKHHDLPTPPVTIYSLPHTTPLHSRQQQVITSSRRVWQVIAQQLQLGQDYCLRSLIAHSLLWHRTCPPSRTIATVKLVRVMQIAVNYQTEAFRSSFSAAQKQLTNYF